MLFAAIGSADAQVAIQWERDLEVACQKAEQNSKLVLVHFSADWSRRSQNIKSFVFTSPSIIRNLNTLAVPVLIDVDQDPQLAAQFGVQQVPTDVLLSPGKKIVIKRDSPGETKSYAAIFSKIEQTNKLISEHGLVEVDSAISRTQEDARQIIQAKSSLGDSLRPPAPDELLARPASLTKPQDRLARTRENGMSFSQTQAPPSSAGVPPTSAGNTRISNRFFAPQQSNPVPSDIVSPGQTDLRAEPGADLRNDFVSPIAENDRSNQNAGSRVANHQVSMKSAPEHQEGENFTIPTGPKRIVNNKFTNNQPDDPSSDFASRLTAATMKPNLKLAQEDKVTNQHFRPAESSAGALPSPASAQQDISPMLQGHCPVTLVKSQKWVAGDRRWGCFHRNQLYLFVDQATLNEFLQAPELYSPLLSGYDPVQFAKTGELIAGKESLGVFLGRAPKQRIALFSNRQNRVEFEANPSRFLEVIARASQ